MLLELLLLPQSLKLQQVSQCLPGPKHQPETPVRGSVGWQGAEVPQVSPRCPPELIYPLSNEGFPSSDKRADLAGAPRGRKGLSYAFALTVPGGLSG